MTDGPTREQKRGIEFQYDFPEPPQKVWRAISRPEFRETWLPGSTLANPEATALTPGEEVRYRMRDDEPPFLESSVTFKISSNAAGGTRLRIIHELTDVRFTRAKTTVANDNRSTSMLAA